MQLCHEKVPSPRFFTLETYFLGINDPRGHFWGGGGGGSFVSRNYNSIPSAQGEGEGRGHGGHLSLGIMIFKCRTRKMEGHLSLGTIVLIVEPGEGVICVFLSVEPGRWGHLSLGIMILHVEPVICL